MPLARRKCKARYAALPASLLFALAFPRTALAQAPSPSPAPIAQAPFSSSNPPATTTSIQPQNTAGTSPSPSGNIARPPSTAGAEIEKGNAATPPDNTVYLQNADLLRLGENDLATLTGNVRVRYRQYTLYSDKATVNTQSGEATFEGHVRLVSDDDTTSILSRAPESRLTLDLKQGSYSFAGAEHAVISPTLLQGSELLLPIRMDTSDLQSDGGVIDARQVGFTTCDFAVPHYSFGVDDLTIVPGKHLIARKVILYRRNRRILKIPELVLPISNRYSNANYLPAVGNTPSEGNFAKFAVPYALSAAAIGILRLDFLQYKGIGTGFDQSYPAHGPGGGGTFSFYRLDDHSRGLQVYTGGLQQQQSIGSFKFSINSQYQSNSYYSSLGSSQNMTTRISLADSTARSNTLVSSTIEQSDYGSGLSRNIAASIYQQQSLGTNSSADIKLDFAEFQTPSFAGFEGIGGIPASTSQTLATNLGLHFQPSGLRLDIQSSFFNSLGSSGGEGSAGPGVLDGLERRPELLLTTTGQGSDPLNLLARLIRGSQAQLGFGDYLEPSSAADTTRLYFGYDTGLKTTHHGPITNTGDLSFQQSFYGDNAAQYLLNGHYGSEYKRGPLDFSATYSTLRAYGFTPFFFDRSGDYNNAALNLKWTPSRAFDLTAATAYDFTRDQGEFGLPAAPWQSLLAIFDLHPSKGFDSRLQTTYDPNSGKLFDVSDDLQIKAGGFNLHSAFDYIPQMHRFGIVNDSITLPIITDSREDSGYKIQALAGYNGENNQFSYQGIAVTRSWHDWELTGTYQDNPNTIGPGQTFYFTFHLKALPGYQPFGVGAFGQGLASGIGQVY